MNAHLFWVWVLGSALVLARWLDLWPIHPDAVEELPEELQERYPEVPPEVWEEFAGALRQLPAFEAGKALAKGQVEPKIESWSKQAGRPMPAEYATWLGLVVIDQAIETHEAFRSLRSTNVPDPKGRPLSVYLLEHRRGRRGPGGPCRPPRRHPLARPGSSRPLGSRTSSSPSWPKSGSDIL